MPLYAVPANVGPRTMDYEALFGLGTYSLANEHQGLRGYDRRRVLDRPRRGVRHAQPAVDRRAGRAVGGAGRGQTELRLRHRFGLRGELDRDRGAGRAAHPHRQGRAGRLARRDHRRLGDDVASPGHGPPRAAAGDRPGRTVAGAAHGQPADQRATGRYRARRTASAWTSRRTTRSSRRSSSIPALARVVNALTGGVVAIPKPPRIDLLPVVHVRTADRRAGHAGGARSRTCCASTPASRRRRPNGEPARPARRRPRRLSERTPCLRRRDRHRAAPGRRRRARRAVLRDSIPTSTAGSATAST